MVPNAVPALLRGSEEAVDLRLTEIVSAPDMRVRGQVVATL